MMDRNTGRSGLVGLLALVLAGALLLTACGGAAEVPAAENVQAFRAKAALLQEQIVTEELVWELGDTPANEAGNVVFFSVCDGASRASVYSAKGETLAAAWEAAMAVTEAAMTESGLEPKWVKADVVYLAEDITLAELEKVVYAARHEFFRYGVAFDGDYSTALLEAEMNGAKIYEYENGGIDLNYLNTYLKKAGRAELEALPEKLTLFRCFGWFCDENSQVYNLTSGTLDYGRRRVETVDDTVARELIFSASDFLVEQIQEDGSFIYGYYPRFGNEIENYNIVRHASTIWSLLCRYRMEPSEELKARIESTIDYMLTQVVYENPQTAYLYEEKDDEIKLGGCGVAVIALTEYMDVFQSEKYLEVCKQLGNGILALMDQETGIYWHVLNGDYSLKEEFRTVYYDGEATFALCRLYALTQEELWLTAAKTAVDHFIEADYVQYKDHWVAYTMNEITKYVTDSPEYYAFALENVQQNLEEIYQRDTTYHTYLELLMASFELYDRMTQMGAGIRNFDHEGFLKTIYERAERMLSGFFYPEYAMYMEKPDQILGTFMVRHDGYRVRIDDVQHNIGGYYLYWKNYETLVQYGLLEYRD